MDNAVTALDLSFGREPLAAFAAGLVEKSCCSRQSLLPDGFARHITESELLLNINRFFASAVRDCRTSSGHAGRDNIAISRVTNAQETLS